MTTFLAYAIVHGFPSESIRSVSDAYGVASGQGIERVRQAPVTTSQSISRIRCCVRNFASARFDWAQYDSGRALRRATPALGARARCDDHSRSIAQHFGDASHYLGRVVADAHDGGGAECLGVLTHEVERLASR